MLAEKFGEFGGDVLQRADSVGENIQAAAEAAMIGAVFLFVGVFGLGSTYFWTKSDEHEANEGVLTATNQLNIAKDRRLAIYSALGNNGGAGQEDLLKMNDDDLAEIRLRLEESKIDLTNARLSGEFVRVSAGCGAAASFVVVAALVLRRRYIKK